MRTLFILLTLITLSCEKDSVFDQYGFYGDGAAKLNNSSWMASKVGVFYTDVYCKPDSCIGIILLHRNQNGELRGNITLNHVPVQTGKQTLNYVQKVSDDVYCALSYSEWASDGDVVTGGYSVFEQNNDNYLEISELNLSTGDITGKFQATVVRHKFWTPAGQAPDTIRITEGTFKGRIYKK